MRAYFSKGLFIPLAIRPTASSARPCTTLLLSERRSLKDATSSLAGKYEMDLIRRLLSSRSEGFSLLFASKMPCICSRASFRIFQFAWLQDDVRVDGNSFSRSTLGNSSSAGSAAFADFFDPPTPADAGGAARSACIFEGSGAVSPSTRLNSLSIVDTKVGLRSCKRSLMPSRVSVTDCSKSVRSY